MHLSSCILNSLTYLVRLHCIGNFLLVSLTTRGSLLSNIFIFDIVERIKLFFLHNHFFFLSSKYLCLIFSAFVISFGGVFCVFFTIPWVVTIIVSASVSQKAKSRYIILLNNVLNSQISEPFSLENKILFFSPHATLSILKSIFFLTLESREDKKSSASALNMTLNNRSSIEYLFYLQK